MTPALVLEWDSRDLEAWRGPHVARALASALSKAGSDAARTMKVDASRAVRQRKRFKVNYTNRSLPLDFPRPGTKDISALVWRMDVSGALVPVSQLPHRPTKKGVVVQINVGASKLLKSAFVIDLKSGHRGVFVRIGKGRSAIKQALTTRVVDVFHDTGFIPAVHSRAQAKFASAFARLLPLELQKVNTRGARP